MPDIEKVIKALECRATQNKRFENPCAETGCCHYAKALVGLDGEIYTPYFCEVERLCADTIALLKEQEPRVLDWDEIKNYSVVYGEFKDVKEIYPLITSVNIHGEIITWNPSINVSDEFMLLVADEEDRKNTRCWNKEPTEEQRQAVKWDA